MWSALVCLFTIYCATQSDIDSQHAYFRLSISDDMGKKEINTIRINKLQCWPTSSAMVKLPYRRYGDIKEDPIRRTELALVSQLLDAAQRDDYSAYSQLFIDSEKNWRVVEFAYEYMRRTLTGKDHILGVSDLSCVHYYFIDAGRECKMTCPVYTDDQGNPYLRLCPPPDCDFPEPGVQLTLGPEFTHSFAGPVLSFSWGPRECSDDTTVFMECIHESDVVRMHAEILMGYITALCNEIRKENGMEGLKSLTEECISGGSRDIFLANCEFTNNAGDRGALVSLLDIYKTVVMAALDGGQCFVINMHPHYILVPLHDGDIIDSQVLRNRAQYKNHQGLWDTPKLMLLYQKVDDKYLLSHMMCSTDYTRFLSSPAFLSALSSYVEKRPKE